MLKPMNSGLGLRGAGLVGVALLLGVGPGLAAEHPDPAIEAAADLALEIDYEISYLGVTLGTARLAGAVGAARYDLSFDVKFSGLARWLGGEGGTSRSRGRSAGGRLQSEAYAMRHADGDEIETVEVEFRAGRATRVTVDPPPDPDESDPDEIRAPLDPEHLIGVSDPLSAFLVPALREGTAGALCATSRKVFSGLVRFDLVAAPVPSDAAPPDPGLVACTVEYRPLGGYYLSSEEKRDPDAIHRVWLRRLPGSEFFAPARIELDAPLGSLVLEARELVNGSALYATDKVRDLEAERGGGSAGASR